MYGEAMMIEGGGSGRVQMQPQCDRRWGGVAAAQPQREVNAPCVAIATCGGEDSEERAQTVNTSESAVVQRSVGGGSSSAPASRVEVRGAARWV